MIRLRGSARNILELCDGQRTLQEIVAALSQTYVASEEQRIADDVIRFLEALQQKRIVDY